MYSTLKTLAQYLRPIPRISVSEWADTYRHLSPVASAAPGKYSTSKTPYMREIMDCLSDFHDAEEVIFMKGAQVGATEAGNNWIGYIISTAPGPMLSISPTEDMAKRNSQTRIDTMIDATQVLRDKISPSRKRDSGNKTLSKAFPGGIIIMAGANSAAALRSMPAKYLFLDEVDAYPADVDGEGSPIELAKARTRTFANRKVFEVSTPVMKNASPIESLYLQTSQKKYFIPCPECEQMQELKFDSLKWDKGRPLDTTKYFCCHCGAEIQEKHKPWFLSRGEWTDTAETENPRRVGYHLSSMYAPLGWLSWAEIAEKYEKAENDTVLMKAFVNTILGETYEEKGEAPEWQAIYSRREVYPVNYVPNDVAFLTAGVDVQGDRLELEIVGWCENKISYSIDYRVLLGNTAHTEVWAELEKVVNETWTRTDGVQMPLRLMAVDSGFNTAHVYTFCKQFDASKVIPVKGRDSLSVIIAAPKAVDTARNGKAVGGVKVWPVGVSVVKSEIYGWLRIPEPTEGDYVPPGYCHFPMYAENYFRGLTAETFMFRIVKGYRKYEWVKKYERNEPLDCRIYARAAASVVGMDRMTPAAWAEMRTGYSAPATRAARKEKRSSFWE